MEINTKRLGDVLRVLRELPEDQPLDMSNFIDDLGEPTCPFGWYCSRPDLQETFEIIQNYEDEWVIALANSCGEEDVSFSHISLYFSLTLSQAAELFGPRGCGRARTAKAAADYFEAFIARRGLPVEV